MSVDKSEISGVMRELSCVTNWDKILDIGSKIKLFELLEVASAYVLALDFFLSRVCTDGGSAVTGKITFEGTNRGTSGVVLRWPFLWWVFKNFINEGQPL